ncbi:IQ domain-containing protein E isoform X1 [Centrocercus urophasianus]|uniref:IQ domain-containing protein E isoform X1 n=1 Tax=Centrocercus urophasianus TaxID=9002 RepID=UPI001C64FF8C|nr:IQ domain-containing protein E isoform X1 [Centrocercus urophasianus]
MAAEGELGDDSLSVITCESDAEMKLKKKIFHKPPKSPKSPYSSSTQLYPKKAAVWRSLQGTGNAHFESAAMKNPKQMWLGSLKQGMSHSLRSDVDTGHMRAGISSSTPEYLKEALGMKKPKHSRSSSNGYIPGTPDYKEKEEMYDEIIELKKTIQAQKNEGNRMKTKLRRLEEENNRKDKQIEQLLDPSRVTVSLGQGGSELARSLSAKKSDNGWVVNGLKQKIFKLEQQCKEKDNTINKFQSDMNTTDLEEMRIAVETYCEEVHRLQILLAKSETMKKNAEGRDTQKRLKALNAAVLRLSRNIKELQNENRCLKEDLDHILSCSASRKTKNYSDWSRQSLMRRILELEKKVGDMENTRVLSADSEATQLLGVSSSPSTDPNHAASQQVDHAEECHRLRELVKKLKSDRSALQSLLLSKDLDIKQLLQAKAEAELELQKYQNNKEESTKEELTLSEEMQNLTRKEGKSQSKLEEEERQTTEDALENLNEHSPNCTVKDEEDCKKEQAAKCIQRWWRSYRSKQAFKQERSLLGSENDEMRKYKKEEIALGEAVVVLQAAFRGHLARQKLLLSSGLHDAQPYNRQSPGRKNSCMPHVSNSLSSSSLSKEKEKIVTFIQSVFRAHLTRTVLLEKRPSASSTSEKMDSALCRTENKPVSAALQTSLSASMSSLPVVSAGACEKQPQPTLSLPVDEAHSDDSDDIVIVSPSLRMKKTSTHFFNGL